MNWCFMVNHFITTLFILLFATSAMADGTVVDAEILARQGKDAGKVKINTESTAVADNRCDHPITVLINQDDDNKATEFRTYSIEVKETEDGSEVYNYTYAEDGKIDSGTEISIDTLFLSKELISRLSDTQYKKHKEHLVALLNENDPNKFQELIFGKPIDRTGKTEAQAQVAQMLEHRGLIEMGRDTTGVLGTQEAREAEFGKNLNEKYGITKQSDLERLMFATGYMKTTDGKLLRISDVLKSGVNLTQDTAKLRVRLMKATSYGIIKKVLDKVPSGTDVADITSFFTDDAADGFCSANCEMNGQLGNSLANLAQIAGTNRSPVPQLYCLLKSLKDMCYTSTVNSRLEILLQKYKPDDLDESKCAENKAVDNQEQDQQDDEGGDDSVEVVVTEESKDYKDKKVTFKATLEGEKADEIKEKGKFYWICEDEDDEDCTNKEDKEEVTYSNLSVKGVFSVNVYFKTAEDGDELAESAKIEVTIECDPEEQDCDDEEECDEDEEDCEDDDGDKRYTWRDFMNQDTGLPQDYPPPPPRFKPTMLPPPRGMTVTPATP
jgi:hypothetical protein